MMIACLIKGGKIIDGTGSEPVMADVAVSGERIEAIGDLRNAVAVKTINAEGRYVCPGFIDAHSHSDTFLMADPTAPSKIYQGVTTEVIGNCGASAAPIGSMAELPFDWQELTYPASWNSFGEYLNVLAKCRPILNVVPLVGHNRIRIAVMGYESRSATADETKKMARLVEECLDQGAWGLSSGLIYRPGKCADKNELTALAKVVARRGGIYTTHMRNEGSHLLGSISETIELGEKSGARLEISHLKTSGARNWGLVDDALAMIAQARERGIVVAADRYPYVFSCTDLDVILPNWLAVNKREAILQNMAEPKQRGKLRLDLEKDYAAPDAWDNVIVGTSSHPEWRGKSIRQIAAMLGSDPAEAAIRVLESDKLLTQAFFAGMNEANLWKILAQPFVMVGSDASMRSPNLLFKDDFPHPRAYGTFCRFLRAAIDGKTVPLAEAIRKITSFPADHFRIKKRGRLAKDNMADIVVFDPATVRDLSSFGNPHQLSAGIRMVMVNGAVVLGEDGLTGNRSGDVLSPGQ